MRFSEIRTAVAKEVLHPDSVKAISERIWNVFLGDDEAYLGNATTQELFDEILARLDEQTLAYCTTAPD